MSAKPVVAWCQPIRSKIDPLTFRSYRMLDRAGMGWHHIDIAGAPVATARNLITIEALSAAEVTHLFWCDSDMVYEPGALRKLLERDLPFVGGLCFDRRPPFKPVLGRYMDPSWGYDKGTMGWLYDHPESGPVEVDATGGAFLLVKREVFESIREKSGGDSAWADWWTPLPEHQQAEDLSFCARVKSVGHPIIVDCGVRVGHVAAEGIVVDADFARRNRAYEAHRWNPPWTPVDARHTQEKRWPLASIVIPTYDQRPEFLRAAVLSALAQTVPVEVIVVDDGSTEFVAPLLAEIGMGAAAPHLCLTRLKENAGIAAALNAGIERMRTDWFCWLSSDDMLEPMKVEAQLAALVATNRKAGCHNYNVQRDNGSTISRAAMPSWRNRLEQRQTLANYCAINGSTVMLHRSVIEHLGRFDPEFKFSQDYEMWARVATHYDWHVQHDILGTRREFGNLTERIQKNEEMTRRRIVEDDLIHAKYRPRWTCIDQLHDAILKVATPGATVLDIGSGLGKYQELLASRAKMTLLDAHAPYLEKLREHLGTRVEYIHSEALAWLATDRRRFDAALAIDFIEHMEMADALKLIRAVKERVDRFAIFTPEGHHPQDKDNYGMGGDFWQTHRSEWSVALLEREGFTVERWPEFHDWRPGVDPGALWATWTRPA